LGITEEGKNSVVGEGGGSPDAGGGVGGVGFPMGVFGAIGAVFGDAWTSVARNPRLNVDNRPRWGVDPKTMVIGG
jgi:hypothetical protein